MDCKVFFVIYRQFKNIPLLEGEEELKILLLDKNSITKLDNLISLPKLEILDCSHNRLTDISEIKVLPGLRTVWFGFNLIENIEPFKALTRLKELDLQRNRISSIATGSLSSLCNLQRLNISFNYISEFSSEFWTLGQLRELNMSNNKIYEIPKDKFSKMFGLEILNLASNNIEVLDNIKGLKDFKGLRNLNLLSNNFKYKNLFSSNSPSSLDDEKENIKNYICEMVPTLRILNWEELKTKVVPKDFEQMSSPVQKTIEVKHTEQTVKSPIKLDKSDKPKEGKADLTVKEKQKKQSESVICIIEDEWNSELQRLKDAGITNELFIFRHVPDKL